MRSLHRIAIAVGLIALATDAPSALAQSGAELYQQNCAACHDRPEGRTPTRASLAQRTPEEIVSALSNGAMKAQGDALGPVGVKSIASYLAGRPPGAALPTTAGGRCTGDPGPLVLDDRHWNGWGRDLDNSRYQSEPALAPTDVPKLKLKWAFGYLGSMTQAQPSIVGNRVFAVDVVGRVYSLDASTGCTYWEFVSGSGARTPVVVGALAGTAANRIAAFFGDDKATVHALDAATGVELWQTRLDPHPAARLTGAPVLYRGRLYAATASREEGASLSATYECCRFRGSLSALDAATGMLIWQSFAIPEAPKPVGRNAVGVQMLGPAGAAIWSAPTIDPKRGLVYVGTGNSYITVETDRSDAIVAFDLASGAVRWSMQATARDNYLVNCFPGQVPPGIASCPKPLGPDFDFGSSPILRSLPDGRSLLLAGQKSGIVYALDPDDRGKIMWQVKLGQGSPLGGIEWGPAADAANVYVAISDVVPFPEKRLGSLTALRIADGQQVWQKIAAENPVCAWGGRQCSGAQSAAVSVIPGVVFSGAQDGHLRAYAAGDGTVIWDMDTARSYATVNGVPASGGSLDVGGPVIANGMLYTNSGYGRFRGQPGNALLAFSVEGR